MKTIIEMAREAGLQTDSAGVWVDDGYITNQLERFEALVRADEREECAKVCEMQDGAGVTNEYWWQCAEAIRARGNT